MSLKHAQMYKLDPKDEYFDLWRLEIGGKQARADPNGIIVKDMKKRFLAIVEALDMDVKHLVNEEDYWSAYLKWDTVLGKAGYPIFLEKIRSYEDPNNRDADARRACENNDFEAWLGCHQKLYIQALRNKKHISCLKERDDLGEEFRDFKTCPWEGDVFDHALYLLKYPKGPSGRDNTLWAEATMKCFYAGYEISKDEAEMKRLSAGLPLNLLKPKFDMMQDLNDEKVPMEVQHSRLKKELEELERKMAKKKKEMSGLKKQYTNLVSNIKRKKTFQNVEWDYKDLPKTKRAKVFKQTVEETLKEVKDLEKMANMAREEAKTKLGIAVEELFK